MTFPELRAMIDARLEADPRLEGSHNELLGDACTWYLNNESVMFTAAGSTGILVEYLSTGRIVHSRIFAMSPLSVDRIVNSSAEHLTAYVLHRM
jgi:hypothetical protein